MDTISFDSLDMDDEDRYCTDAGPFTGEATTSYPDGSQYATQQFKDGFKDGPEREFHQNGRLAMEGEWKYGIQIGVHREWYEDGTPKTELDYTNGLPTVKRFNPDGTPAGRRRN
ncbi:toxin-antitoxin system YwqK family antitoxin [Catenuloplanes sp. NPDC051500]|uniref:toxin-antitoxin system YwqK family antitoxin n=1 Tax=Catenuloplanes sp. NPDC051500 TaxID=3363959 RepID=UPI003791E16E